MISVVKKPENAVGDLPSTGAGNITRLHALRSLLAEKFPAVELRQNGVLPTGLEALDDHEGGLRRGKLTEITGSIGSGGLMLEVLLSILAREKCFAALVDGSHGFAPQDFSANGLSRLLVVLCENAGKAIKSADLLLRDGNLSLIILDLQMVSARELQKIPVSTWHRFQRVVEQTDVVFAVLSSQPMVEGAAVRIALHSRWNLSSMRQRRTRLQDRLEWQVFSRSTLANPLETVRRTA